MNMGEIERVARRTWGGKVKRDGVVHGWANRHIQQIHRRSGRGRASAIPQMHTESIKKKEGRGGLAASSDCARKNKKRTSREEDETRLETIDFPGTSDIFSRRFSRLSLPHSLSH